MFATSLPSSVELANLRKFKSLASKSCTSESLAYFFYQWKHLNSSAPFIRR